MSSLQYDAHQDSKQSFRKWLDEALQKGSGKAHRWTNTPNAVEAIDPFACDNRLYHSPVIAVEHRAAKWSKLWCRDEHNIDNIKIAISETDRRMS